MSYVSVLLRQAERVRARAPKGLFRFLSVGVVGLAIHTGVFTVLYRLGLDKSAAWLCALAVATFATWELNRRLTFAPTGRRRHAEIVRYASVTILAQGVSFITFLATCDVVPRLPPPVAVIVGAVVATGFSYTGQRFFTFAPARTEADAAAEAAVEEIGAA